MKKIILIVTMILLAISAVDARDLRKMTETARNRYLLKTAKEAIQKYAPDYYRYTDMEYRVEYDTPMNCIFAQTEVYRIRFSYNEEEECFVNDHSVEVHILAETGVAIAIASGNGLVIATPEWEPLTRGQEPEILKYHRMPPISEQMKNYQAPPPLRIAPNGRIIFPD